MAFLSALLSDESGFVVSSEAVLVGTVGVAGATVGLSAASDALHEELKETAFAIRSLDQSYSIPERRSGSAWTAGSSYRQPPVEESLAKLRADFEREEAAAAEQESPEPAEESPRLSPRQQRRLERERGI